MTSAEKGVERWITVGNKSSAYLIPSRTRLVRQRDKEVINHTQYPLISGHIIHTEFHTIGSVP